MKQTVNTMIHIVYTGKGKSIAKQLRSLLKRENTTFHEYAKDDPRTMVRDGDLKGGDKMVIVFEGMPGDEIDRLCALALGSYAYYLFIASVSASHERLTMDTALYTESSNWQSALKDLITTW